MRLKAIRMYVVANFRFGHIELEIKRPILIRKRIRRKYLLDKFIYYIIYEYCKMGPYTDITDAEYFYSLAIIAYL